MNDTYYFKVKRKRPEENFTEVSEYFKGETLRQYASSKNIMNIQIKITLRALELLNLRKKDALILDAGSGPGYTAMYLNEIGYKTVALDIISEFLRYYDIKNLNPIAADMCFLPFKPNSFDAIISISALQWIFKDIYNESMINLLRNLSKCFFQVLKPNTSAVFQFYPKNKIIMDNIGKIIQKNTPFKGNFIIDNPYNQRKRKIYLLLNKGIELER